MTEGTCQGDSHSSQLQQNLIDGLDQFETDRGSYEPVEDQLLYLLLCGLLLKSASNSR